MSDYEKAVELVRGWIRDKHPDKPIEAVPAGEVGSFLVRDGRAQLLCRVFILKGYTGFIYPGKWLPIPEYERHLSRIPCTYFVFQERLEYAYVIKGKLLEACAIADYKDLGKCYLIPKEDADTLLDLYFSGRLDKINERAGTAVSSGVRDAGLTADAEQARNREQALVGPLFGGPKVEGGPGGDYSGL